MLVFQARLTRDNLFIVCFDCVYGYKKAAVPGRHGSTVDGISFQKD